MGSEEIADAPRNHTVRGHPDTKLHSCLQHAECLVESHEGSTAVGLEFISFYKLGSAVFVNFLLIKWVKWC